LSGAPLGAQTTTPIFVELKFRSGRRGTRARAARGTTFDGLHALVDQAGTGPLLQGLVTAGSR